MTRPRAAAPLVALLAFVPCIGPAAPAVDTSLRPQARTLAIDSSPRPEARARMGDDAQVSAAAGGPSGFAEWIEGVERRARARGISNAVLRAAFDGLAYDPDVIRRDRNQAEFNRPIWEYLDSAVSAARVQNGRAALSRHRGTLAAIERRTGVPAEIVVAVWGLESAYGAYRGSDDVIRSLATLAYDGRRGAFFEAQLMAALEILQAGDVAPRAMRGSWAGAMGHTQFMPTSFLEHAVDFDGDGRRDIWGADPTDALASTAAYLARHGWTKGQPWGVEVVLPGDFDHALAGPQTRKTPRAWARLGVRDTRGRAVPDHGRASILLPAGARGPALMVFDNFRVLERYNPADAYVIGVGHLADRIGGGPPIAAEWPRDARPLGAAEREELQERLTRAGFDTRGIDGRIGPNTQAAIRRYQQAAGLVADGYPSRALLERLR
jgi:lytic murein transglycosylase